VTTQPLLDSYLFWQVAEYPKAVRCHCVVCPKATSQKACCVETFECPSRSDKYMAKKAATYHRRRQDYFLGYRSHGGLRFYSIFDDIWSEFNHNQPLLGYQYYSSNVTKPRPRVSNALRLSAPAVRPPSLPQSKLLRGESQRKKFLEERSTWSSSS
jgi:hypothetical protein